MRILIAGGTGAIGRPLVPMLTSAGHDVHVLTRDPGKIPWINEHGADAEVCDALDAAAVDAAVKGFAPDVIVDLLTSLPQDFDPRKADDAYRENDRIRREGTGALVAAAEASRVGRYIVQSVAFLYAPLGSDVVDETAPAWTDAPPPFDVSVDVLIKNEAKVVGSGTFRGIVLRYGFLYGPGTWYETGGSTLEQIRKRQFPVIGDGAGVNSLVHVYDAARATKAAIDSPTASGVYNIVDDDPAPLADLLPDVARIMQYRPPRRIPKWLASLVAGKYLASAATEMRGASNAKAREELGWIPSIPSWREGFERYRDTNPQPVNDA